MFWNSTKAGGTYKYRLVFSLDNEPSDRVHDIHGEWELEDGEAIKDASGRIIAKYFRERGIHPQSYTILRFDHR